MGEGGEGRVGDEAEKQGRLLLSRESQVSFIDSMKPADKLSLKLQTSIIDFFLGMWDQKTSIIIISDSADNKCWLFENIGSDPMIITDDISFDVVMIRQGITFKSGQL